MTEIQTLTIETFDSPTVVEVATGPRGERGDQWSFGPNTLPANGEPGDIYLVSEGDVGLGDIYQREFGGTWVKRGNIKGLGGIVDSVNGKNVKNVVIGANDLTTGTLPDARLSTNVLTVGGAQTISGVKTFTANPVVPDGSFTINKTTGLQQALDSKQGVISVGTSTQYYRGDKTWATLDKAAVGLANVDNTSDANKPISTATQAALNAKANLASPTFTGTVSGITKSMVGLANVDNTSDANKPVSTAVATALAGKANTVHTHTPAEVGAVSPSELSAANAANRARANHTGTQPASTITGLAAVALSGSAADLTGVLPASALPPLAISDTFTVASQAAMLALTAQRGDVAIRTDNGRTYILVSEGAGVIGNWKELTPAGQVISVAGKTGAVTLVKADVGLSNVDNTSDAAKPISTATQAALDTKSSTGHSHTLESLTNVTVSNIQSGHIISFNGSQWVNVPISAANVGAAEDGHGHNLSDPNMTGILPISKIPTGTTGTTVALGNHTHDYSTIVNRPTLGTAAALNVATSGNAGANEVVKGTDSRLTDSRTPKTHTHARADITDFAHSHTKADISDFAHSHIIGQLPVAPDGASSVEWLVRSDDSRLSDARTPVAHSHAISDITGLASQLGGKETPSGAQAKADGALSLSKSYTDIKVAELVDSSPSTLNTLNELAAALGDDPNFATTITTQIGNREPKIAAGTTSQFWRGDKTWQALNKAAVGLGNVDNTADAAKPVSTATQTALNAKANTVHGHALTDANMTGVLPVAQLPTHQHWAKDLKNNEIGEWVPNTWFHPDGEPPQTGTILSASDPEVPAGAPAANVLKITNRDNIVFSGTPYVTGKPGEVYRLEAWVASAPTTTRQFNLYIFSANSPYGTGMSAVSAGGTQNPSTTWTKRTFDYTVPSQGAGGRPYIRPVLQINNVAGDAEPVRTWYVTGFSMRRLQRVEDLPVASSGTSSASLLVRADDARLSNARTPVAHNHAIADITSLQTTLDGKASSGHGHSLTDANITGILPIAQIPSTVFHTSHLPEISEVNGLQTALDGKANTLHHYHQFTNGSYYYDDYNGGRFLRTFTQTSANTTLRWSPITNVEYHNGTTWVAWSAGLPLIKDILNGRDAGQVNIPRENRRFRFTVTKPNGWPLLGLVTLVLPWTGLSFPGLTVKIEESTSTTGTWTLMDTAVFGAATTGGQWGTHMKATTALHTGRLYNRIEFDINNWTDSGGYTQFPIQSFEIYSNYQGQGHQPWSWNYDKTVTFSGEIVVGGQQVVKQNDSRLTDARTPLAHTHRTIDVVDVRTISSPANDANFMPTPSELTNNSAALYFSTNGDGQWKSYLTVKGWTGAYASWQIIGPANTSSNEDFFIRSGHGSTWNASRRIWHSGNLDPQPVLSKPQIAANTDWNTLTTQGVYKVATATYTNNPPGYLFGTLVVHESGNSVTQTYYPHVPTSSEVLWSRTKWNASDWQPWKRVLDADKMVPAHVGLGNVTNLAQVSLSTAQVIDGAKTFNADITQGVGTNLKSINDFVSSRTERLLGTVAGDMITTRRHTHYGNSNQFHIVDMVHRGAAGSDWTTTQHYAGIAVDNSFQQSPVTGTAGNALRTWILRDPQNARISIGNAMTTYAAFGSSGMVLSTGTFQGNGSGLTALNGSNISSGTIAQARLVPNVHREPLTVATAARPTGVDHVEWIGPVKPNNATTNDTWVDTSASVPAPALTSADPIGSIIMFMGFNIPTGWFELAGQELPISTYGTLYNNLTNNGTVFPYGANTNGSGGGGSTHFRLPNFKGKTSVGHDAGDIYFNTVGKTGGEKRVTLNIGQIPSHSHTTTVRFHATGLADWNYAISNGTGQVGTAYTSAEGGGGDHENMPPYMVVKYIIKAV